MRNSRILIMSLPVFLAGCTDFFSDDSDSFHTGSSTNPAPVAAPAAPPAPPPPPPAGGLRRGQPQNPCAEDCGCSGDDKPGPKPIPSNSLPTNFGGSTTTEDEWQPSEHQKVLAADLIRELEHKHKSEKLSRTVLVPHIQSRLGLNSAQTNILLDEIGQ